MQCTHRGGVVTVRYKEFRPTQFDVQGLGLADRQDWWVGPCIQTRDSGALERANFRALTADLEDKGLVHETHRFGHWGPGWFEIVLVKPGREDGQDEGDRVREALSWIAASLADYPVYDDEYLAEEVDSEAQQTWEVLTIHERMELCGRHHVSIFAARRADYPYECQESLVFG